MEHFVQFLGLVLFISANPGYHAILPMVDGSGGMPKHDAMILAPHGEITFTGPGWVTGTLTQRDLVTKWDFGELHGDTVEFVTTGPGLSPPSFLIHLNDDCCRTLGSVRTEYLQPDDRNAAAKVIIEDGDAGWSRKGGTRVDTVVKMTSAGVLKVNVTKGGQTRHATIKKNAVIANFPRDYITTNNPPDHEHHFRRYYDMVTFGFFCSAIPAASTRCTDNVGLFTARKHDPVIEIPKFKAGELHIEALDIACSNSQYP